MEKNLTLGITKIEDLLINRSITKIDNGTRLENIDLKIPEYQRPYKWTAKNANQLLDDIEDAMDSNKEVYRVGTLILHYDEKERVYNIVDGQQRVITFSLLLKCLGMQSSFLGQKLHLNSYNINNIKNNHRTLTRRVDQIADDNILKKLLDYVRQNCELIVVITTDLSEAFQFFDSQNARGKTLYPHDLLKAYHLREMNHVDAGETERIVKTWEDVDQRQLSVLFKDYLYRLKEWIKGNRPTELNEHNIDLFKGISVNDNHPYAQYHKGAFAYANELNRSSIPFVTGIKPLSLFQLNTPIIAGQPFFEYTKHYFDILADIQNNSKYEGYFINDNEIVKTLNLRHYRNGVGNGITRLMFDTAILLYVDRFCPSIPSKNDLEYLDQFVNFAFIWAYSMRAQYTKVGWAVAQNYIMGTPKNGIQNSFNLYKTIINSDSPNELLGLMSDKLVPLKRKDIYKKNNRDAAMINHKVEGTFQDYLHYFNTFKFLED